MALRLLVAGAASLLALTLAPTATAAYNPTLLVGETSPVLGGAGSVRMFVRTRAEDDPTATITIYSPRGYALRLGQAAGTELGSVIAFLGAEAVQGTIRTSVGDPSNACAPGPHDAVWEIALTLAGRSYRVPVYVDRLSGGPEAAHASARMHLCLGSVPMRYADITVGKVFTNPSEQGTYAWNAVFVPRTDPAARAQSTSYVSLPATFSVAARRKQRFADVTACLREGGHAIEGVRVTLYYGGRTVFASRKVAVRLTNTRGCVTTRIRIKKPMVLFASVHVPIRQAAGCTPSLAPRCSEASIYPPSERFKPVRIH
jgi:hypothetical protein